MRVSLPPLLALSLAACVTSPLDYSYLTSKTAPVKATGQAGIASDTLELQVYAGSAWVTLDTTTSASIPSTSVGEPLYKYAFDPVVLPSNAWVSGCGSDSATLRVLEGGSALGTFTESGWDCVVDELFDGTDWATAGSNCHTGKTIRLLVTAPPC
jgi:hypothetical protein